MTHILDAAWILVKILNYGGLTAALAGVVIFGWHFVGINARAARGDSGDIPRESWRGKGARLGTKIFVIGIGAQFTAYALSDVLPHRF